MTLSANQVRVLWGVALALFAVCWVLPIIGVGKETYLGYQGARFAHERFWELLTQGPKKPTDVFAVAFISIGWLANELFLVGLVLAAKWPLAAMRVFAFSLGIVLSWQVAFADHFPLRVGYWAWCAAGALALGLTAKRRAAADGRGTWAAFAEPASLILLLVPVANAAIGVTLDQFR